MVGIKSFINEFAAYDAMRAMGGTISERSRVIATYALCGFSNPASIGIQVQINIVNYRSIVGWPVRPYCVFQHLVTLVGAKRLEVRIPTTEKIFPSKRVIEHSKRNDKMFELV